MVNKAQLTIGCGTPLAQDHIEIARSENPQKDFMYSPHLLKLDGGRILASYDISDKSGYICASDDGGKTWQIKAQRLFCHGRMFADGDRVYLIGQRGDLVIFCSSDCGETWSEVTYLSQGQRWHQAPCSVWYKDGFVYLVMERVFEKADDEPPFHSGYWIPNIIAPVVMRGKLGSDLTKRENWLFSEEVRFRDIIKSEDELNYFGVPFLKDAWKTENWEGTFDRKEYIKKYDFENNKEGVNFIVSPIGWLETNIVQITDERHYWYDKTGKTLHLFMRGHTAGSGYCCMMKAVERVRNGCEVIDIECEKAPSGKEIVFLPMPGGQMKFFIKYDEVTKLYWLLSTQATDTMCSLQYLPDNRYNIPCDERDRAALHFSKNMVDWCFAGLVAKGENSGQARNYGSMEIDGDDLIIALRSGDRDAFNAHCGNLITFHRVKNFRNLVY